MRALILILALLPLTACTGMNWIWDGAPAASVQPGDVVLRARNDPFPAAVTACGSKYSDAELQAVSREDENGVSTWRYSCIK